MGPKVTEMEMELFYNSSEGFKNYVDRYSKKHQITPKMAMQHLLVRYAYLDYKEKSNAKAEAPTTKQEKIFDEDKAC